MSLGGFDSADRPARYVVEVDWQATAFHGLRQAEAFADAAWHAGASSVRLWLCEGDRWWLQFERGVMGRVNVQPAPSNGQGRSRPP